MGLFLEAKANASLSELHDKPVKFDSGGNNWLWFDNSRYKTFSV